MRLPTLCKRQTHASPGQFEICRPPCTIYLVEVVLCKNMKSIRLTECRVLRSMQSVELHLAKYHHITYRLERNTQEPVYFNDSLFYDVLKR